MGELLRVLIDILSFAWPFRPVLAWERGIYFVLDKPKKVVGPGRWPVIPYFFDVHAVSIAPAAISTPMQFVTLKSGAICSFSVTATVQVEDVVKAVIEIDDYKETIQELLGAIVSEALADAAVDRFETAQKRLNLLREVGLRVDEQTAQYGVRCHALRFTNFAMNLKTFRLIQDPATASGGGAISW